MTAYEVLKVKDTNSNGILNMVKTINPRILSEAKPSGYSLYGVFFGLLAGMVYCNSGIGGLGGLTLCFPPGMLTGLLDSRNCDSVRR